MQSTLLSDLRVNSISTAVRRGQVSPRVTRRPFAYNDTAVRRGHCRLSIRHTPTRNYRCFSHPARTSSFQLCPGNLQRSP